MVNVGPLELLLVGIIALIFLGPKRLPEFGRSMGRGMREFRDAIGGANDDDDDDEADERELSERDRPEA